MAEREEVSAAYAACPSSGSQASAAKALETLVLLRTEVRLTSGVQTNCTLMLLRDVFTGYETVSI